jgi:hypothetical protein
MDTSDKEGPDYDILSVVIDDFQMVEGKMCAVRIGEARGPGTSMLFHTQPFRRGEHKEIYMVRLSSLC